MEHDSHQSNTGQPQETESGAATPTATFESITFSDGTTVSLEPTDVVVLVGPNNVGKSLTLRELEQAVSGPREMTVIKEVQLCRSGTVEDLRNYLDQHARLTNDGRNRRYQGYRFSIRESKISSSWPGDLAALANLFCMRLQIETRIIDSNPAPAIPILDEPASHPIHMLYSDDELERRISNYFHQAFGKNLIVYRLGGNEFPVLVGENPVLQDGEDRISDSYCRRLLDSTVPLQEQGDGMRSFASVILHLLAPITPSILILDEPEAFLHPPQAKLLGELIAKERSSRSQLFVATHSPDVLNGLLSVAPDRLRVLRIRREGQVNYVKELDKERAKALSIDPLMKYSSVLSGVFHERVIICESDADCTFYSTLLDLPEVHGNQQPDVFFVHANGKHRMAALAKALRELDVPVDVIADIDVLRSDDILKDIVETLGGDWGQIQVLAGTVRSAVEQHKPWLNAGEIKNAILKKLETVPSEGAFPKEARSDINAIFRKASPWDAVKEAGEAAIPAEQATQQFQRLEYLCKQVGLWIVPVGELEGFCKSVGGHGPRWVQRVIAERDLSSDSNLQRAREFVREIWASRSVG